MKKKKPKVSIIIMTKDTPLMILKRCINSLYEQTIEDIEIIIIDMNDEKSTFEEAIQSEKETDTFKGITFFEMTDTKEYVASKNRMLNNFHGDYLAFISSQDTMPPKRLELAIDALESHRDKSVVCTNYTLQANNVLDISNYQISSTEFLYLAQLVFHKDSFRLIGGFDEYLVSHVDDELVLRLDRTGQLLFLPGEETSVKVAASFYHHYSAVDGAIGCRQLYVKYKSYYQKNKKAKKALYAQTALHYRDAGLIFRYIQFYTKALFTRT